MADEKLTQANETPTSPEAPLEEVQAETPRDARAMPVETLPQEAVPEEVKQLQALETPEGRESRRSVEAALNKPIEAIEDAVESIDHLPGQDVIQEKLKHHDDSPVVFLGRTFNTDLYTFVFGLLAAATAVEVVLSSLLPPGLIRTLSLASISLVKALLVMAFYMHLREDNKIFAVAIAFPFFIVSVSLLFLLAVPQTGYGY
ncbi:MAG: cytochrome C oxidase subunit IV family protein [Anaerolineae bacterium]